MRFDEEGRGFCRGRRAVELAMKGGKLALEVSRLGGRRGPVGVGVLPSNGMRVNGGRRGEGAREERREVQGMKTRGLTP